jgi:hypothetical protein
MAVDVTFDLAQFSRELLRFTRDQVPFATSLALNATIFDARDQLVEDLPKTFTIRSNWTEKGMKVEKATKKFLIAVVGSTRDYMALQATGGTKQANTKKLGLPVKARPTQESRITPSKFPGRIIAKGGFVNRNAPGLADKRPAAVFAAVKKRPSRGEGKRKRKSSRPKLRLMYYLVDSVDVPQRWDLEKTLNEVAAREWVPNMRRAWRRALRSRRRS